MKNLVKFVVVSIFLGAVPSILGQSAVSVVESKWIPYLPEKSSQAISTDSLPKLPDGDYQNNGTSGAPLHPDQVPVKARGTDYYVTKDTSSYYINKPGSAVAPEDVFKGQSAFDAVVKFMNNGSKPIRSVEADFVFYRPDGTEEVSYHLISDKTVEPGSTVKFKKTVTGSRAKGYSHFLTARSVFIMRNTLPTVIVRKVIFADGTVSN